MTTSLEDLSLLRGCLLPKRSCSGQDADAHATVVPHSLHFPQKSQLFFGRAFVDRRMDQWGSLFSSPEFLSPFATWPEVPSFLDWFRVYHPVSFAVLDEVRGEYFLPYI